MWNTLAQIQASINFWLDVWLGFQPLNQCVSESALCDSLKIRGFREGKKSDLLAYLGQCYPVGTTMLNVPLAGIWNIVLIDEG